MSNEDPESSGESFATNAAELAGRVKPLAPPPERGGSPALLYVGLLIAAEDLVGGELLESPPRSLPPRPRPSSMGGESLLLLLLRPPPRSIIAFAPPPLLANSCACAACIWIVAVRDLPAMCARRACLLRNSAPCSAPNDRERGRCDTGTGAVGNSTNAPGTPCGVDAADRGGEAEGRCIPDADAHEDELEAGIVAACTSPGLRIDRLAEAVAGCFVEEDEEDGEAEGLRPEGEGKGEGCGTEGGEFGAE